MSRFSDIRALLGLTQEEIAEVLGCSQPNVSFLDRGQTVTPAQARAILDAARSLGVSLTLEHVYGEQRLPLRVDNLVRRLPALEHRQDWPSLFSALSLRGWGLVHLAGRLGVRVAELRDIARGECDAPHAVGCALLSLLESGECRAQRECSEV